MSMLNTNFVAANIKAFYCGSPMEIFEYISKNINNIREEIIVQYNLGKFATNWVVHMEIRKGIAGLKQAGKINNQRLQKHLSKYIYTLVAQTLALWCHLTNNITFTLCVNNAGIKYIQHKLQYLLNALWDLFKKAQSIGQEHNTWD